MLVIAIRTDKPEAEISLFEHNQELVSETWQAHRLLAETLHHKIVTLLESQGKQLEDITGIICYVGPGSFTGLRIGLSVANSLGYGLNVPIVGVGGEKWQSAALELIISGTNHKIVLPEYGQPVHITQPKH